MRETEIAIEDCIKRGLERMGPKELKTADRGRNDNNVRGRK